MPRATASLQSYGSPEMNHLEVYNILGYIIAEAFSLGSTHRGDKIAGARGRTPATK
ncbi:MAG: hypothetical protein J7K40_11690 [candidate division Zixibacteria bacterium]|nr:hypothetical protein [candidate division Zixibacteria bacterium]